mmetsp:Transcript_22609/g.32494  ORF Transcript_22609/g.32494 Transcript_22609/m.32494 type:complete len:139 (-) Transcript_22609:190-606(-)
MQQQLVAFTSKAIGNSAFFRLRRKDGNSIVVLIPRKFLLVRLEPAGAVNRQDRPVGHERTLRRQERREMDGWPVRTWPIQLTDRSMAALYEAVFTWGKRRNSETAGLLRVELNEGPTYLPLCSGMMTRQVRVPAGQCG